MKPVCQADFQAGELYYFAPSPDAGEGVWGLFDCRDAQGVPCLEIWSRDFAVFGRRMAVPAKYAYVRTATREELRDFAYNMGYERI